MRGLKSVGFSWIISLPSTLRCKDYGAYLKNIEFQPIYGTDSRVISYDSYLIILMITSVAIQSTNFEWHLWTRCSSAWLKWKLWDCCFIILNLLMLLRINWQLSWVPHAFKRLCWEHFWIVIEIHVKYSKGLRYRFLWYFLVPNLVFVLDWFRLKLSGRSRVSRWARFLPN